MPERTESPSGDPPTVLVVEDERGLADLYATWLEEAYSVRTAYDGEEALSLLDETVDVVLLDRRMPGLSGDDVLERIRDRSGDRPVALLTAVSANFDIVDMEIDGYVTKPVTADEVHDLVASLLKQSEYEASVREYFAIVSKVAALEETYSERELADSEEYVDLQNRAEEIREEADENLEAAVEASPFDDLFHTL